jgi:MtN3 and saliva related transmembrane protein
LTATDWLGLLAGTLTTIAFVPQALKIWITKSADDVSYLMFGIFSVGIVLWLAYGIVLGAMPIIVANVVTLVLSVVVIALKVRYSGRRGKQDQEADLP